MPKVLQCLEWEAVHLPWGLAQIEYQERAPESVQRKLNILPGTFQPWQCQTVSGAVPFTDKHTLESHRSIWNKNGLAVLEELDIRILGI